MDMIAVESRNTKPYLRDVPNIGTVLVLQPVVLEALPSGSRVGVVVRADLEVEEALVIGHHVDVHIDHLFGVWDLGPLFRFTCIYLILRKHSTCPGSK